jgi:hypothetical protein
LARSKAAARSRRKNCVEHALAIMEIARP